MSLTELLTAAMNATVPPYDADPKLVNLHRWRITIVSCSSFIGVVMLYAISMGLVPTISSGFATSADVQELRKSILDERASTLDQQLFNLRVLNCKAASGTEKSLYRGRIQDLEARYYSVTGRPYELPQCSDF